jgi:hypothetical protein
VSETPAAVMSLILKLPDVVVVCVTPPEKVATYSLG